LGADEFELPAESRRASISVRRERSGGITPMGAQSPNASERIATDDLFKSYRPPPIFTVQDVTKD